jgi:hypothetical protein
VIVVDPLAERSQLPKAWGLHARTLQTLELRGLVDDLVSASVQLRGAGPSEDCFSSTLAPDG